MSAPTPDPGAVEREALAWALLIARWGGEESRSHQEYMVREYGENHEPWRRALEDADIVLAAGWSRSPRPAAVSEEQLTTIIANTLDRLHVPESADRDGVEMDAEEIMRDLLPHLAPGQSETGVREAVLRLLDTLDSSPRTKAYIERHYLGLGFEFENVRAALARTAPAEDGAE